MADNEKYVVTEYNKRDLNSLLEFFERCLPESGRIFDPKGVHKSLLNVEKAYEYFICLKEQESGQIIGTCALKKIDDMKCELKCVYLYKKYHGMGLGTRISQLTLDRAKEQGYREVYLDTISETSGRAIKMYERLGFINVEKYHDTVKSDVFMKLILK
ncbi:GNAT family N-acetyltransferase [Mobilitalea sibirica]|uniref:GNAT family N-acetyltransferase n=1 Tax=Mobilitalea sibirica TaxID=1462919 RepID=A0A8J7H4X4_9FIRM|nr:GNAT family N-acetyltransferase [Mobilitalea sibirica]MBH1942137.1 GNAT family N-acetyltransferase [Mobilitalea sibirica]